MKNLTDWLHGEDLHEHNAEATGQQCCGSPHSSFSAPPTACFNFSDTESDGTDNDSDWDITIEAGEDIKSCGDAQFEKEDGERNPAKKKKQSSSFGVDDDNGDGNGEEAKHKGKRVGRQSDGKTKQADGPKKSPPDEFEFVDLHDVPALDDDA